jgi:hypothetical protein
MVKIKAKVDNLTVGDRVTGLRTLARGEVADCSEDRARHLASLGQAEIVEGPGPEGERAFAQQSKGGEKAETMVRRGPGVPPVEHQVKKG